MATMHAVTRTIVMLMLVFAFSILVAYPITVTVQGTPADVKLLNDQAHALYQQGKYEQAIPLAERIVEVETRLLDPSNATVATARNNLAALYLATGFFGTSR